MRMQFVPLPRMNPRQPSSTHIFFSAWPTDILYSVRPTLWTWNRILRRSSGETTVRETAPATPPPQKAAMTGSEMNMRDWAMKSEPAGAFRFSMSPCEESLLASRHGGHAQLCAGHRRVGGIDIRSPLCLGGGSTRRERVPKRRTGNKRTPLGPDGQSRQS